jgi:CIC family chloride channel protein
VFQGLLPDWSLSVGTFTILGMVAFFGSIANTPISTILMVSEMTGNYNLLVPSMWVCILAFVLNRKVRLYRNQLPNRFESPVHRGSMISGILRNLRVADLAGTKAKAFVVVRADAPLVDLAHRLADSAQTVFPVVDDAGALLGVVSHNDLRPLSAADPALWRMLVVDDAMSPGAPTVGPDDALSDVLRAMESRRDGAVVVRSDDEPPRPLAVISHDDIMDAYRAEIAARR